jgi:hypothetical protein
LADREIRNMEHAFPAYLAIYLYNSFIKKYDEVDACQLLLGVLFALWKYLLFCQQAFQKYNWKLHDAQIYERAMTDRGLALQNSINRYYGRLVHSPHFPTAQICPLRG